MGSLRVVSEARRAMRLHEHGVFKSASRKYHRPATLGVEEKQQRDPFAFFLRCRIGNDVQRWVVKGS